MLTITTPADDRNLLTQVELRLAAGLGASDATRDEELEVYGLRVSDIISQFCGVAGDGLTPVTLRAEVLTETFRNICATATLMLSRRFCAVSSIVVDGDTLDADEYEVQAGTGFILRLVDGVYCYWTGELITVIYSAGFATVPTPLKEAASSMVRMLAARASRDPLMKREQVVDVGESEFWVGPVSDNAIPADVQAILGPYRTLAVG